MNCRSSLGMIASGQAAAGAEQIVGDIKSRLARGELKVSDILKPIVQQAKDYGVSVRQVRQAMRRLSEEGVVRTCPHVGT